MALREVPEIRVAINLVKTSTISWSDVSLRDLYKTENTLANDKEIANEYVHSSVY